MQLLEMKTKGVNRFIGNQMGGVAIMFALSIVVLAMVSLGALQIGFTALTRNKMQNALDTAVLAALATDDTKVSQVLNEMYAANIKDGKVISYKVTADKGVRTLTAQASFNLPASSFAQNTLVTVKSTAFIDSPPANGDSVVNDFEGFTAAQVNTPAPPLNFAGITFKFDGWFTVNAKDCKMGFWGGGCNYPQSEFASDYSGKSITNGSNGNAQFKKGIASIYVNSSIKDITFKMCDLESQFSLAGDYIATYDGSGKMLSQQFLPVGVWTPSGLVKTFTFNDSNVRRIDIKSQDPIGIDNLRFTAMSTGQVAGIPRLIE